MSRDTAHDTPPVDAACIVLLRDGAGGGLEVLLLERHGDADVAGGALVFPGGTLDPADHGMPAERWRCGDLDARARVLGATSASHAVALSVTAVRETFEEAGIVFARRPDGTPVGAEVTSPAFVAARRRVAARGGAGGFAAWLAAEGLTLDLDALLPWSWWVTPTGRRRRFDTRFFLARLPDGQDARHDEVETTAQRWMTPLDALQAHERGTATVIFPTRRNLRALASHRTAAEAVRAAREGRVDLRRIQPRMVEVDGRPMVVHPDGGPPEPVG